MCSFKYFLRQLQLPGGGVTSVRNRHFLTSVTAKLQTAGRRPAAAAAAAAALINNKTPNLLAGRCLLLRRGPARSR